MDSREGFQPVRTVTYKGRTITLYENQYIPPEPNAEGILIEYATTIEPYSTESLKRQSPGNVEPEQAIQEAKDLIDSGRV